MAGAARHDGSGKVAETDFVPLSALQHHLFCPRQCALIHVEREWAENRETAEGRLLHERTDKPGARRRADTRTLTALPLRSVALGVTGIADVVEMHGNVPFPVEYKRGRPKAHRADEVQLCAQAICLEEMLAVPVPEGALFYGERRRRMTVEFDADLRALTHKVAAATRRMIASGETPAPVHEAAKCSRCSLIELCRPRELTRPRSARRWLAAAVDG